MEWIDIKLNTLNRPQAAYFFSPTQLLLVESSLRRALFIWARLLLLCTAPPIAVGLWLYPKHAYLCEWLLRNKFIIHLFLASKNRRFSSGSSSSPTPSWIRLGWIRLGWSLKRYALLHRYRLFSICHVCLLNCCCISYL